MNRVLVLLLPLLPSYCYEGGADGSSGGGCGTSDDNDVYIRSGESVDTDAGTLILVLVPNLLVTTLLLVLNI